jgi:hypothetical protein
MDATEFFILRHGKPHGPCSLEELKTYLAYGSLKPTELVGVAGSGDWQPVSELLAPKEPEYVEEADGWWARVRLWWAKRFQTTDIMDADLIQKRRRSVRYRDWDNVPARVRSGKVFWWLLSGFLFFPPRLWAACSIVFTQRIVRNHADANGYLKSWPAGVEVVCTLLIIINALAWWFGLQWLAFRGLPVAREAFSAFSMSLEELMQSSGRR